MRATRRAMLAVPLLLGLLVACSASTPAPQERPPPPPPPELTHVVFQADYGLFTVPLAGGEVVKLGGDTLPCQFAALVGDRVFFHEFPTWDFPDVWSVRLDGTGRAPLANSDATERLIGVIGERALIDVHNGLNPVPIVSSVLSVPVAGGPPRDLGKAAGAEGGTWGWLVDGQPLLWNGYRLLAVRPDGLGLSVLVSEGTATAVHDGWVALNMADDTAAIVRLDGSNLQRFPQVTNFTSSGSFGFGPTPNPALAWGELLFTAQAADTPEPGQTTGVLYAVQPGEADPTPLWELAGAGVLIMDFVGSKVILSAEDVVAGTIRLFAVDLIDGGAAELAAGAGSAYYVGQGGGHAALFRPGTGSTWDLLSVGLDGTHPSTLAVDVKPGLAMDFTWGGPDPVSKVVAWAGDRFLFRQAVAGSIELRSVHADGTGLLTITQGDGDKVAWAVSGTTVVYGRTTGGQSDLHAVEIDGTNHRTLAGSPFDETVAIMAGQTVVYTRINGQVRDLFAVPLAGGNSLQLTSGFTLTSAVVAF